MKSILTLTMLLAAAINLCCAQSVDRAADETAIRKLVNQYSAARGSQDRTAIAALFTEDADQLVSSGEWRRGKPAMAEGMLASSAGNPGERTISVDTVRFLHNDAAIADARYVIAASSARPERRMWSTFVAVRTAEGWRIAAIRNMLPAR